MATWNSQCCRTNNSPLILHVHHKLTAAPLYTLFTLGPRLIEELLSGTLQPVVEGKESKYSVLWLEKLLQRSVPHYLPPSHFMLTNPRQDTCPHLTVKCQELAYAPTGKGRSSHNAKSGINGVEICNIQHEEQQIFWSVKYFDQ